MSTVSSLNDSAIRNVVEDVLAKLGNGGPGNSAPSNDGPSNSTPKPPAPVVSPSSPRPGQDGVFEDVPSAAAAAQTAFEQLRKGGYQARAKVIEIVKTLCLQNAEKWGAEELAETKIGRLDHKIAKLQIVKNVPGIEWINPFGMSGDHGISMEEYTPFGVVGAILPSTHSVPTLSGNIINIVAAGNAVIFNPHPAAAVCAAEAVRTYNRAISRELGIENLVTTILAPTLDSFDALCKAPEVGLLCVTGGPGVVDAAMKSGKRALCAGPGNPPVVIDESARLDRAAADLIQGGAFDNNLLCIGEKEVFVVDKVYNKFLAELDKAGAAKLNDLGLERLTAKAFTEKNAHLALNRDVVGKDPAVLAEWAQVKIRPGTELLYAETDADHPFVYEEQMCPVIPIVRVKSFEEAVSRAKVAEHGYKHSSLIQSLNVEHMTVMARELDTTLFIKNGPCMAGLGMGGEGYLSYSICTTTGEGITTPKTFTRTRRCVMVDALQLG